MDMSLFDQVVSESYGGVDGYDDGAILDNATEAAIDDIITDDPVSVFAYTGECLSNLIALEAAEAKMEGQMAVQFMVARANGDEATMEHTVATMEGFVGNVWEGIKELIAKAYAAIKNWLIKAWNKFKGYANVVKAFFTKYGDVLRSKRVPGCMVKWTIIDVLGGEKVYDNYEGHIQRNMNALATYKIGEEIDDYNRKATFGEGSSYARSRQFDARTGAASGVEKFLRRGPSIHNAQVHGVVAGAPQTVATVGNNTSRVSTHRNVGLVVSGKLDLGGLPSPHIINSALKKAIYPRGEMVGEVSFERIRGEAIEAADISTYKKYIDNFLALGDKAHSESLKVVETCKRNLAERRELSRSHGTSVLHSALRRCLNAKIELHRLCMSAMYTAAKRMQSQSIQACRKAIMFHATKGQGATYADESYNPQYDDNYGYANESYGPEAEEFYASAQENADAHYDKILDQMGV